jgi:uncharacterized protein YpmS
MANLPKFSGKYTTAGAYERPQTVLDKSGFIYAKTLSDLGQGFNKALQGVFDKRNAEALQARKNEEENYKFQTQQQQQLISQLAKAGINNNSLYKLGFDLISANSKLSLDIKQAQNQEDRTKYMNQQARVMRKLGEYQGLIAGIQDSASTYSSDVIENPSKVGQQGGVATVGTDQNKDYNLGMPALTGTTKNASSEYYLDKDMNFRIRLTSDQISKQTEKGYIDQDAGLFLSFDPLTVPNIDKEISDVLLGAKITDKNGNITQEYVDINNAKFVTNDQGTMRYAVEATNVAGAMATTQNARNAMIGSYLQDPQKAQIIYQQIFGNNEKLEIGGGSKSSMFTPESERKFVAAFDQYFEALIPQTKIGKAQAVSTKKSRGTSASPVSIEKINAIKIPFGDTPGPATESGQTPKRPVDILKLEGIINTLGFNKTRDPYTVNGVTVIEITKSTKGRTGGPKATLRSDMTGDQIKDLLISIQTGEDAPAREQDPFLQYQIN